MQGATTGIVRFGINRIYSVSAGSEVIRCRIKGKVLQSGDREYNPLAPGDIVRFERPAIGSEEGLIVSREDRQNRFWRWNRKREAVQTLAANLGAVCCVTAAEFPPFRPRFIDRLLVVARLESIPFAIILNKSDLPEPEEVTKRLAYYVDLGVPVVRISATTGAGIAALPQFAEEGPCALVGPSGVGKSSLLNALDPSISQPTGAISAKYNRGTHVTNFGRLLDTPLGVFVDTPGVREIDLTPLSALEIASGFDEIDAVASNCEFSECSHTHEPGCAVRDSVKRGRIHPDRYESYCRILADTYRNSRL